MRGFGAVVTGTVRGGQFNRNDTVVVQPDGFESKIRSIQVHGLEDESAAPGQRAALNLSALSHQVLERGMVVTLPDFLAPSALLTAQIRLLKTCPRPLRSGTPLHLHLGSAEVVARIVHLGEGSLKPGESGLARLHLESPILALPGDAFVLRHYSPLFTLGGGLVLENLPGSLKRRPVTTQCTQLRSLVGAPDAVMVRHLLANAPGGALSWKELFAMTGFCKERLQEAIRAEGEEIRPLAVDSNHWALPGELAATQELIVQTLSNYYAENIYSPSLRREELVSRIERSRKELVRFGLEQLVRNGGIVAVEDRVALPGRAEALSQQLGRFLPGLEASLIKAGFSGMDQAALRDVVLAFCSVSAPAAVESLVDYLIQTAQVIRIHDNLYLHPQIVASFTDALHEHFGRETPFDAATVRDIMALSRKVVIDVLEYLDRVGVTLRIGNQRRLK